MSKFILTDWEINGYDDSDFMCSYYDDVTNQVGTACYGSTRYPSPHVIAIIDGVTSVVVQDEALLMPTAEVVEKARKVLADYIFDQAKLIDKRSVDEPEVRDLKTGLRLRLTANVKMQVRETQACQKCGGSGKWTNPRNEQDKRDCFNCKGTGQWTGGKAKGADGKQVWLKLPAGLAGEVVDWKSFGTFYANGYNQPSRYNTTVQFRTADGKVVRASLNKLRLDRDYLSDAELRETAERLSRNYQFSKFYPKHAWDTHNFAMEVVQGNQP